MHVYHYREHNILSLQRIIALFSSASNYGRKHRRFVCKIYRDFEY